MYTGRKLMIEILVAEDDEMIANLIKINLVKAGYSHAHITERMRQIF